jgi:hypothetical protein
MYGIGIQNFVAGSGYKNSLRQAGRQEEEHDKQVSERDSDETFAELMMRVLEKCTQKVGSKDLEENQENFVS